MKTVPEYCMLNMKSSGSDFTIYIDGASSGNPGDAGIGVLIKAKEKKGEEKISQYIGRRTNNFAEYQALIIALHRALKIGAKEIHIKSDSELLVKQIKEEYKVKSESLKKLNDTARRLLNRFHFFEIEHIKREFNKAADALAKKAIKEYKRANRMVAVPQVRCTEESPSSTG